jgi:thiamine kinase-like enzyme
VASLNEIVERLERRLGPAGGPPVPLEGGITNRNFRLRLGDSDYVVRLPGQNTHLLGISREAERLANQAAAELGSAPAVAAAGEDFLVTRFLVSRPAGAEELLEAPESVAVALRSFHDCGVQLPVRFWVPELLDSYASIVRERGGELPGDYALAQDLAHRIEAVLPLTDPVPCHNDLLPANLLRVETPETIMLVDWEYAGMGHRLFDLGNLAVNNDFDEDAELRLLRAYLGEPPGPKRTAALRLMRLMSDAREAAWGVLQAEISELDFDFRAYARRHFTRLADAAGDPHFEEWLGAAAA